MKPLLHLGKNSLWLLIARVGAQALSLFTLLLARKLGSAGFGEYAFMTTVIFIGNVLTTCGTDMFFIREIAAHDDLSRLPAALWIQLFLSGLFISGVMLVAPILPNHTPDSILALQIYSLTLVPLAFYSVFTTALRGKQRMDSYALLNLVGALLQVLVVLIFVAGTGDLVSLAFLMLASQWMITALAGWLCTVQLAGFWRVWRFSWVDVRAVFVDSALLGLLGLLGLLYQRTGVLLLALLSGASLTGLYAAALRVMDASRVVHIAALTALYPLMAQAQVEPSSPAVSSIRFSWKVLLAGSVVLALGLSLLAAPITNLLYGAEFVPSAPILQILAWTLIPYSVSSFLSQQFVARHQTRTVGWALTASILGLGLFSIWWIPAQGLQGVAWAVLSAECLQAFLLISQILRRTPVKNG